MPRRTSSPLKRVGIAFLVVFAAIACFLLAERIRGARNLESRLSELSKAGERLKVVDLEPKRVPDPENAVSALLALTNRLGAMYSNISHSLPPPPTGRIAAPGKLIVSGNLPAWSSSEGSNNWVLVREAFAKDATLFDEIHEALLKPGWDEGINYRHGFHDWALPPIVHWKTTAQLLGTAALAGKNAELSVLCLEDMLRLVGKQSGSPLMLSQLVRISFAGMAWNTTWELISRGSLNEEQLFRLQTAWGGMDFSSDMSSALEVERAMLIDHFELLVESPEKLTKALDDLDKVAQMLAEDHEVTGGEAFFRNIHKHVWRFAWARQDELKSLNRMQEMVELARVSNAGGWVATIPRAAEFDLGVSGLFADSTLLTRRTSTPYERLRYLFSSRTLSENSNLIKRPFQRETQRRMAILAIALERYRLRNGKSPERLDALVPVFIKVLPVDMMNRKPFGYHLSEDGAPVLYSVGDDGKDDGGDFSPVDPVKPYTQIWNGKDAVWPLPASAEEAERELSNKK